MLNVTRHHALIIILYVYGTFNCNHIAPYDSTFGNIMSTELEERMQQAVALFKRRNYSDALTIYTELIQTVTAIPVSQIKRLRVSEYNLLETPVFGPVAHPRIGTLLDGKAATLGMLGRYDLALQSARKITVEEPLSCKGYIRVGKILQVLGRKEEAYKTYQKGLYLIKRAQKKYGISVPESLYSLLKENYKQLNSELLSHSRNNSSVEKEDAAIAKAQQMSRVSLLRKLDQLVPLKRSSLLSRGSSFDSKRSNSILSKSSSFVGLDVVEFLPFEILEYIFSFLPMTHLLRCRTVSKTWSALIDSFPHLIEFRCKSAITYQQFQAGVQYHKKITQHTRHGKIKTMSLRLDTKETKVLDYALESLAFKLTSLEMQNSRWNMPMILNRITIERKKQFFAHLETLLLTVGLPFHSLTFLASLAPKLKNLTLIATDANFSMKNVITGAQMAKVKPNTEFEHLEVAKLIFLPNGTQLKELPLLNCLGHILRSFTLVCQYWDNPSGEWFMNWLASNSKLKQLYLEGNGIALSKLFESLSQSSINLDKLVAREGVPSSDNVLANLNPLVEFPFLSTVRYLDFYSVLATFRFQEHLLQILRSSQGNIETLNLGRLGVGFQGFLRDYSTGLNLKDILILCPNLKNLYVNELMLDNHSLLLFNKAFQALGRTHLNTLDLSFCNSISGTGLIRLFDATTDFKLTIDLLVLDGLLVDLSTLGYLVRSGFVRKIQNDPIARRWNVYGTRSLIRHKS